MKKNLAKKDIRKNVIAALLDVVPEAKQEHIDAKLNFRDQFEIDSVDYLNFIINLEKRLGIKIPELDYPKLSSLGGCLTYLDICVNPA